MKNRYKSLIIILIAIPAAVLISIVMQSIQYNMTISQFEKQCHNMREQRNLPDVPCMWPGGPPKKPILEIPQLVEIEHGNYNKP